MIGILGGGESGTAAARLAIAKGKVPFVSDSGSIRQDSREELLKNNVRFEESGHTFEILARSELIVKSPGIPNTASIVSSLKSAGLPVISELEFAFSYCKAPIIAITGSNGKTTTTNLIHHLLQKTGIHAEKGGNLGRSFSRLIVEEKDPQYYVLEVSSFQLDDVVAFKPFIAAILNITADHLDRYDGLIGSYAESKLRITMNQKSSEHLLIYWHDAFTRHLLSKRTVGAAVSYVGYEGLEFDAFDVDNPFLRGEHNAINASFAIRIGRLVGLEDSDLQEGFRTFVNDDHRMQVVAVIDGVEWINDSKATNVDAAVFALRSQEKPIVWIAGGTDKGNDYTMMNKDLVSKIKALICLGKDNAKIRNAFFSMIPSIAEADNMKDAVRLAAEKASEGDVVLLSPACASFDLFDNYEDRGRQFMQAAWKRLE